MCQGVAAGWKRGIEHLQRSLFGPIEARVTKVAKEGHAKVLLAAATDRFAWGVKMDLFNFTKLQRCQLGVL